MNVIKSANHYSIKPPITQEAPKTFGLPPLNQQNFQQTAQKIFGKVSDKIIETFAHRLANRILDGFESAAQKLWTEAGTVLERSTTHVPERSEISDISSYARPAEPTRVLTGRPRSVGSLAPRALL